MTVARALILALAVAVAIEAGIYYLLVGLGTGGDLIVYVEMIWLCVAAFFGTAFVDHFDHTDEKDQGGSRLDPR